MSKSSGSRRGLSKVGIKEVTIGDRGEKNKRRGTGWGKILLSLPFLEKKIAGEKDPERSVFSCNIQAKMFSGIDSGGGFLASLSSWESKV
jgi:hypothetical protein